MVSEGWDHVKVLAGVPGGWLGGKRRNGSGDWQQLPGPIVCSGRGHLCLCSEVLWLERILDIWKLVSGTVACNSIFNIGNLFRE